MYVNYVSFDVIYSRIINYIYKMVNTSLNPLYIFHNYLIIHSTFFEITKSTPHLSFVLSFVSTFYSIFVSTFLPVLCRLFRRLFCDFLTELYVEFLVEFCVDFLSKFFVDFFVAQHDLITSK